VRTLDLEPAIAEAEMASREATLDEFEVRSRARGDQWLVLPPALPRVGRGLVPRSHIRGARFTLQATALYGLSGRTQLAAVYGRLGFSFD
jgi:hypothetical protein